MDNALQGAGATPQNVCLRAPSSPLGLARLRANPGLATYQHGRTARGAGRDVALRCDGGRWLGWP
eukprot:6191981-Pleurochrysis_carterae.AAC.6